MKSCGIFAASALFGALVNAAPVNKRDMVYVTETDIDVITIPVTTTVWVDGGATSTKLIVPTTTLQADFFQPSLYPPVPSTTVAPVETSTSTSSSVYVAPTTSSTSVYVAPTSTSVYVAPSTSTSTSIYVAPSTSSSSVAAASTTTEAPTTASVASTATSSTAAAATTAAVVTTSDSSSSGVAAAGTSYTGDLTWYDVGLGACGLTNVASDHIVAISEIIFDNTEYATADPNDNPLCGRYVSITGSDGSAYQAKVVDRCTGCAESDLDLSEDFFNIVTDNGNGRVPDMTWVWL